MAWTPEIPTFSRAKGKDGKSRLYLVANNELDIIFMLWSVGLTPEGIRKQDDDFLVGYHRIIKSWEEKFIRKIYEVEAGE